jgi:two-component system, cell cycle sensor histidine kinase and response regulator CckA
VNGKSNEPKCARTPDSPPIALGDEFFRRLAENASDVVFRYQTRPVSRIGYISPAAVRMVGYSPEEFYSDPVLGFQLVDPEDLRRLKALGAEGKLSEPQTVRLAHRDGHSVWVELRSTLVFDAAGRLVAVEGIARDVTEQRLAQEALRASERRYRELADSLPETVFEMDLTGRFTFVNETGCRQFGVTQDDVARGISVFEYIAPEVHERVRNDVRRKLAGAIMGPSEYVAVRKDGSSFPCAVSSARIAREGSPVGLRGFLMDITERKRAEETLRESEARFRRLIESPQSMAYRLELYPERKFSYVSSTSTRVLGWTPEELVEDPGVASKIIHPEDLSRFMELANTRAPESSGMLRAFHKDGRPLWLAQRGVAMCDGDGKVVAYEGLLRNLTEYRIMEEQLMRAQRLETAGRIAGQVAHDFNNLLSPLMAFTELLKVQLPPNHPGVIYCDQMLLAVRRMAEINNDLLAMGRRGQTAFNPLDLSRVVHQAVSEMTDRPDTLLVQVDVRQGLTTVKGAEAQLHRVVSNLITNARDAMQDVGQLTIAVESTQVERPFGSCSRIDVGEYVRLSVSDTGCGIAPEARARIFDAFFTTKRTDLKRGSGLGLSVVQAIVEDHHGYVDVETEVGIGTTIAIYLPACHEPIVPLPRNEPSGGTETLLVVDDDYLQLSVAESVLGHLGYAVRTAPSGEEALAYLADNHVDLMILDMLMQPGIDGVETYRRALALRPGLPTIFLSGYAEPDQIGEARNLGATGFVSKPVRLERLAEAVRAELDRQ